MRYRLLGDVPDETFEQNGQSVDSNLELLFLSRKKIFIKIGKVRLGNGESGSRDLYLFLHRFQENSSIIFSTFQSHSIGSAPSSLGSNSSKRFSRRYRTVNMRSEVDENLFGPPNRIKQAQQMRENKSSWSSYS